MDRYHLKLSDKGGGVKNKFTALSLVQWAWPIEIILVTISWLVIVFFCPGKMDVFIAPMGYVLSFIGAQAAIGFGGTPLKKKLEISHITANAKNGGTNAELP